MRRTYLVRHARATERGRFEQDDALRPLDKKGRAQALWLADELSKSASPPELLLCSPARRCLETLAPFEEQSGVAVKVVEWLAEGEDPLAALECLRAEGSSVVAACTHGDVIWGILEWMARGGVDLGGRPDAGKASVWTLDWPDDSAEGAPLKASYLAPPAHR
jgi:phosphohistidine phosphatase SixA